MSPIYQLQHVYGYCVYVSVGVWELLIISKLISVIDNVGQSSRWKCQGENS